MLVQTFKLIGQETTLVDPLIFENVVICLYNSNNYPII